MPVVRRREGSGIKKVRGPHTKDHVGAMHRFKGDPKDTFQSQTTRAYRFTDDMREVRGSLQRQHPSSAHAMEA